MNTENFLNAVNSLKLYRRAELLDDDGKKLINELYVDPLPNDHVLKTLLRPTTTFLVGRKGTGKSTIFQRAQESLSLDKSSTWAYIDIKTLYESSVTEIVGDISPELKNSLSSSSIQKLTVFRNFTVELIKEIKNQIDQRVRSTFWAQVREAFTGSALELFEKLDEFVDDLQNDNYINVTGSVIAAKQSEVLQKDKYKESSELSGNLASTPSIQVKIIAELVQELEKKRSENYSEIFIRAFNIRGLILRLREILSILKLKHIYIFIDDFSELPRLQMEELVDTILAPFNNWSEEFIKLKVAVYPGRLYAGNIDLSKIDEVYLDVYRAYGRNDVSGMEEKATDFTQRLVVTRLNHFCQAKPEEYFETEATDFWRTLFFSCLGNPRILGYILYYGYETNIIYGKRIGLKTIQDAARRYYEEKIDHYFRLKKFLHETFGERSSIYSLKELLEEIVKRAKELRSYRDSQVMRDLSGRPPTSHFHIISEYDPILSSLELNFFVTKYYEMKDRDGREVSVYALNYGLCQQQTISFGRPREKREHRLYLVERIFDYSPIISSYLKVNQEIVCDHCGHRHSHDKLPAIQMFDMLCPECKSGTCRIINLSRKYESLINQVSEENLLPETDLGILKTLHDERRRMFAKEIGAELDCSYQLVGKRGRLLAERNLLSRDENERGRRVFEINSIADGIYFSETKDDVMDFGE